LLWFLLIGLGANVFTSRMTPVVAQWIEVISGLVLLLFAAKLGVDLLGELGLWGGWSTGPGGAANELSTFWGPRETILILAHSKRKDQDLRRKGVASVHAVARAVGGRATTVYDAHGCCICSFQCYRAVLRRRTETSNRASTMMSTTRRITGT